MNIILLTKSHNLIGLILVQKTLHIKIKKLEKQKNIIIELYFKINVI